MCDVRDCCHRYRQAKLPATSNYKAPIMTLSLKFLQGCTTQGAYAKHRMPNAAWQVADALETLPPLPSYQGRKH